MDNEYCQLHDGERVFKDKISPLIDLCCICFPSDEVWLVLCSQYCMTDLDFEKRARQLYHDLAARVLIM